jgi:hypothetical protein
MATKKTANRSTQKSAAKKSPAKKSSGTTSSDGTGSSGGSRRGDAPRASAAKRPTGLRIASDAARQLLDLTGREAEGITGVERTDDLLALDEIETDGDGDVQGYRRLRRYVRGAAGES